MTVLLSALRGGRCHWRVEIGGQDYTDALISVKNISKQAQLDGSYISSTVTVDLYGELSALQEGAVISISFVDEAIAETVKVWIGKVSTIARNSKQVVTVTSKGVLSDIDESAKVSYPRAGNPRWLHNYLLPSFLPSLEYDENAALPYTDTYHRSATRFSTKYSTLAGLSGIAQRGTTRMSAVTESVSSTTTLWTQDLTENLDIIEFENWGAYHDTEAPQRTASWNPLCWHTSYGYISLSLKARQHRLDMVGTSYWPKGQDKYYDISLTAYGNSSSVAGDTMWPSFGNDVTEDSEGPAETYTSWKGTPADRLTTISYAPPANATIQDTKTFDDLTLTSMDATTHMPLYGRAADHYFYGTLKYKHINATAQLTSKIRSTSDLGNETRLTQTLYPVTIAADDFEYKQLQQIAVLGSIGLVESGADKGFDVIDMTPENGTIYEIPICKSTCSSVSFQQNNPLPVSAKVNFRDPLGRDYTYNVPMENGSSGNALEVDIMQGMLVANNKGLAGSEYSLAATDWADDPGFLIDRWTGVSTANGQPVYEYFDKGYGVDLDIVNAAGDRAYLDRNFTGTATTTLQYCVREKTNAVRYTFASDARVQPKKDGYYYFLPQGSPWLDIYPLTQYLNANHRCFINHDRPSWTAEVPMAFINCTPGTVVIIDLPEIVSEPYLALVIAQNVSSESGSLDLTFIPMFPASGASQSDWPNISEVLRIATSADAKRAEKPYIPADLLYEPLSYQAKCPGSGFSGSSWWYTYKEEGQDKEFKVCVGDEIALIVTNRRTGARYNIGAGTWYYDAEYHNHAYEWNLKAIFGEYSGNFRLNINDAQWGANLVFNTENLPSLAEFTFYLNYTENNDHGWIITHGTELQEVALSPSTYHGAHQLQHNLNGFTSTLTDGMRPETGRGFLVQIDQWSQLSGGPFTAKETDILTPANGFNNVDSALTTDRPNYYSNSDLGVYLLPFNAQADTWKMVINDNNAQWIQSAPIRIWVDVEAEWR